MNLKLAPLLIILSLISCRGNNPGASVAYTEFDYEVKQVGTTTLQLAGQPFQVPADNCGGIEPSTQTTTRSQKFVTELNIQISNGVAAELGGSVKIAEAVLTREIESHLGIAIGVESEATSSLEIKTPPGARTTTTLQWKAKWTRGDISIIRPDGTFIDVLPFAVLNSLDLEQQKVETVDCKTGQVISQSAVEETLPTAEAGPPTPSDKESNSTPSTPVAVNTSVWPVSISGIPPTDTQFSYELNEGEVLMLTGGRIQLADFYCGDNKDQICVVIIEATKRQNVSINALIPLNNWLGVTPKLSPEQALSNKQSEFWMVPNCSTGCSIATVAFFKDGQLVDKREIKR